MTFLDPGPERHPHAIDFGANAGMADAGVDGVGEINRCRPARQFHHIALGREAKDLVGIHLHFDVFEELVVIFFGVETFGQTGNPLRGIDCKSVLSPHTVAIRPMGCHAGFGHFVHLARTDLDLNALAVPP